MALWKLLTLRIANVVALTLTAIWLGATKEWEPAIGVVLSIAGLITQDALVARATRPRWDQVLFDDIIRCLPSEGAIAFLRKVDVSSMPFEIDAVGDIVAFLRRWRSNAPRFRDKILDNHLGRLLSASEDLVDWLERYTGHATVRVARRETQEEDRLRCRKSVSIILDSHRTLVSRGIATFGKSDAGPALAPPDEEPA